MYVTFNYVLNVLWCGRQIGYIHLLLFHLSNSFLHLFLLKSDCFLNTNFHRFFFKWEVMSKTRLYLWQRSRWGLFLEELTEGARFLFDTSLACRFAFDHHSWGFGRYGGWFKICLTQLLSGEMKIGTSLKILWILKCEGHTISNWKVGSRWSIENQLEIQATHQIWCYFMHAPSNVLVTRV